MDPLHEKRVFCKYREITCVSICTRFRWHNTKTDLLRIDAEHPGKFLWVASVIGINDWNINKSEASLVIYGSEYT